MGQREKVKYWERKTIKLIEGGKKEEAKLALAEWWKRLLDWNPGLPKELDCIITQHNKKLAAMIKGQ